MSGDSPLPEAIDASGFKISIVAARFNGRLVGALLDGVVGGLREAGVRPANIAVVRVPGSNELPLAAALLAGRRTDAVVALGVIIRGDTIHYQLIAEAATQGLMQVSLSARVPVINGVIAAENAAQARARCTGKINRGLEFAQAAVAMAALRRSLSK